MLKDFWKRIWDGKPKCSAEMKLGVQVFRDVHCQLPAGHAGRHQSTVFTSWPNKHESTNVAKIGRETGITKPWPAPGPSGKDDL